MARIIRRDVTPPLVRFRRRNTFRAIGTLPDNDGHAWIIGSQDSVTHCCNEIVIVTTCPSCGHEAMALDVTRLVCWCGVELEVPKSIRALARLETHKIARDAQIMRAAHGGSNACIPI